MKPHDLTDVTPPDMKPPDTKPPEPYANGDDGGCSSDGSDGSETGWTVRATDGAAPARALAALNALRRSRQHYDVVLAAGGAELCAHGAVLAAASPYLLQAVQRGSSMLRVRGVEPGALHALLDYLYTGRLAARSPREARALYAAAWRLRVEPARAALADHVVRRAARGPPPPALAARALPDLPPHHLAALDAYIADNFEEICSSGALGSLPQLQVEMMRDSSSVGGAETPRAVADAALAWLRDQPTVDVEELCARPHLLYVDAHGALRDCGELPAARGDAPELLQYRRDAAARRPAAPAAAPAPAGGDEHELGERVPRAECAVVAARAAGGAGGCTRALLAVRGALVAARVRWSDVAAGGGGVARGAALGGEPGAAGAARRAQLAEGRCAHGAAALHGRLLVCGGYDRARVLRSAEVYCPATNAWSAAADMRGPRARFPAARLGDAVWALGGSDGHAELDSVHAYTERGGWRAAGRLPQPLSHAAAAAHEAAGALYVLGGWAAGTNLRRVLRYEPAADRWTDLAPLNTGRAQCAGVVWQGALWALGGCDAWHCLASTERLALDGRDAAAWAAGPALPTARRSVGGCVWRGRLVSAGGSDGAASLRRTDWLAADAGAAGWRAGPPLRRARAGLALLALHEALYAVGGFDGKDFLACVECLYQPDGEWTALCDPPRPARPLPPDQHGDDRNQTGNDRSQPEADSSQPETDHSHPELNKSDANPSK